MRCTYLLHTTKIIKSVSTAIFLILYDCQWLQYRNKFDLIHMYFYLTNIGFPNGPVFRYGNFFIPRVEKSSQISPWEKNFASRGPTALGRTRFFALGLIFEDFSTLGMKKFPYLKTGPFGNPIFCYWEIVTISVWIFVKVGKVTL